MRRALALLLLAISPLPLSACGSDPVTKEQFVDHAVTISNPATSTAEEALRKVFGCAWAEVSKDEDLVDDFMSAESSDPDLSAAMSPYLGKCAVGASK